MLQDNFSIDTGHADSVYFVFESTPHPWDLAPQTGYMVLQSDLQPKTSPTGTRMSEILPETTRLVGTYPNPFNPRTTIEYQLAKPQQVSITIYDVLGKQVGTLVDEYQAPGEYQVRWDTDAHRTTLGSGVYFLRFVSEEVSSNRKLLLVK